MTRLVRFALGERYPLPIQPGMTLVLDPGEEAPGFLLQCVLPRPSIDERASLKTGPLSLALLPSAPLVWILLYGAKISFDAPFAIGVYDSVASTERLAVVKRCRSWAPEQRQLVEIHGIDEADRTAFALRAVSVSRDWMGAFADALASCPTSLSRDDHRAAVSRDYARWPSTDAMFREAKVIEIGGAV